MTSDDLATVNGEIKAILDAPHGTPTAKLIAVFEACGITDTKVIAAKIGITERAVRKAKSTPPVRNHSSDAGTTVPEPEFRGGTTVPEKRNHSSEISEPQFRGKKEVSPHTPLQERNNYHLVESSPSTTDRARDAGKGFWTTTLNPSGQQGHAGVSFANGSVQLHNGTRQRWLDQFDGDAKRLDLALIEIAGQIQPNSGRPISVQVEALLARKAGDKLDRDRRYASAARSSARTTAPNPTKRTVSQILAEKRAAEAAAEGRA